MKRFNLQMAVQDIPFDIEEFHRHMGFGEVLPSPFDDVFIKVSHLLDVGTARAEAVIFHGDEVKIEQNTIMLAGIAFNTGGKVTSYLRHCEGVALFICSLGIEFERRMKSFHEDPIEAYFADTIGSLQCEALAGIVHHHLMTMIELEGYTATNHYGPGYCNWNVHEQQKLFSFFTDTQTGITLNDSSLMSPIKSVSGMVGFGKGVKQVPYACCSCTDVNCLYRKLKTK